MLLTQGQQAFVAHSFIHAAYLKINGDCQELNSSYWNSEQWKYLQLEIQSSIFDGNTRDADNQMVRETRGSSAHSIPRINGGKNCATPHAYLISSGKPAWSKGLKTCRTFKRKQVDSIHLSLNLIRLKLLLLTQRTGREGLFYERLEPLIY